MAKVDSRRRHRWEDAAALILLGGGGVVAWWGTLGAGLLWVAPLIAVAALTAAGALGVRPALVVAVAWVPIALLAAGLPVAALAPASFGTTTTTLRDGAEALTFIGAVKPLFREGALAVALLAGGVATILAGIAWSGRLRSLTLLGLVLGLMPLATAIALQQTTDAPWLGALLLAAIVLRSAEGRFLPIAAATALVGGVALFGAQVAAPQAGWQPFGHESHPDQFHELTVRQTYGPLEGERTGEVMFEVTAPRPALWRMQVLEAFDNRRWRVANTDTRRPEPAARAESVKVEVRGLTDLLVASPGKITAVRGAGETVSGLGDASSLFEKPTEGDTYRVEAETVDVPASRLASIPVPIGRGYLADTQIGLGPLPTTSPEPLYRMAEQIPAPLAGTDWERLFHLSARLAHGTRSELGVVRRVERYLMDGGRYQYTTDVGRPAEEPVFQFLFHTRQGYCQHFAGAAALLLRVAGVPTRVAVGFATGEQVDTHTWAVRDEDAHAWIEVYFPTVGWVPFNPTPAAAEADIAPGIDVLQATVGPASGPDGLLSGLAGAVAALLLLVGATRLIARRGSRSGLADLLVRLSPGTPGPGTTLRGLHPALGEIGPETADLALVAERSRFAPRTPAEPRRPTLLVWRALVADAGPVRGSVLMLKVLASAPIDRSPGAPG